MIDSELAGATRLAIAGLIGLGVGLEREWSGHTTGPDARFAGIRTFLLLGLLGGSAGLLASEGYGVLGSAFALGGAALSVAAYVMAARRPGAGVDGTTEAAALVVLVLAAIAGLGWLMLAAGTGSVVVLVLSEKNRLHGLVRRLGETELQAALQFTVLAVVVLPLLPSGPLFGSLEIRPRSLWAVVLLFSALNFAGYLARRAVGSRRGYGIAGALGGVISSTGVTLNFSRQSRTEDALAIPLARGVIAACTVLVPRVLVVSAVLNPAVTLALAPLLVLPFIVGLMITLFAWPKDAHQAMQAATEDKSPLRLASAVQMAVAFQVAITAIAFARSAFGTMGLYGTAAVLGLTDVDALTVSMSSPSSLLPPAMAARALAIGILANTLLKLTLTIVVGRTTFRRAAAVGLLGLAVASVAGLALL
jgi:uncharacterized membrane protein (DUF4010 family)